MALTGNRESYFASYPVTLAALADTLKHGWSFRGQPFPFWAGKPRGAPCDHLNPAAFVLCTENHDQVGNRAAGERLAYLIERDAYHATVLLLCLSPYTPMLFKGQEWASSSPFLFFTDHEGEHGRRVSEGRKKEFSARGLNASIADVPDPQAVSTFESSKLDWNRGLTDGALTLKLFRGGLQERRHRLTPAARERSRWRVASEAGCLVIRHALPHGDRALVFALAATAADASAGNRRR